VNSGDRVRNKLMALASDSPISDGLEKELVALGIVRMPINVVLKSDPGRVREVNEDTVSVLENLGLVVLADGMGGYNAGEVASRMAVEAIADYLLQNLPEGTDAMIEDSVESAVASSNAAILAAVDGTPEYHNRCNGGFSSIQGVLRSRGRLPDLSFQRRGVAAIDPGSLDG